MPPIIAAPRYRTVMRIPMSYASPLGPKPSSMSAAYWPNIPSMNTSEWAKLMSLSTPYTRV